MGRIALKVTLVLMGLLWFSGPVWAQIESSVVDGIAHKSFHKQKATLDIANEAAASKGLTSA